jgi:NAD(P)-dependent dehydrogenase (short-subunit alcohol dehydrogenase family)
MVSPSFDISGRVAVVTGGYGVLGGRLATDLARAGARVAILGRNREKADALVASLTAEGLEATTLVADALDVAALTAAREEIESKWGVPDILVNAAGGNVARARSDSTSVFDVPIDAFDEVLRLNMHGTVIPTLVFGESMAKRGKGSIITITSMAAMRSLSGVLGYSIAKSGVERFTKWMAVDLAKKYGDGIRVNAIAPGFFVSEQNRAVLIKPDGSYTPRAENIVRQTPMGRFGRAEELSGAVIWLSSDAASFVTGAVIPIDGGFIEFAGV